jgi:hypothetical protein
VIFFQVNLLAAKAIHSYKSRSTALRFEMELEDWPVGSKVPIRTSPELEEFLLGSSESLMLVWCARRRLPFACERSAKGTFRSMHMRSAGLPFAPRNEHFFKVLGQNSTKIRKYS